MVVEEVVLVLLAIGSKSSRYSRLTSGSSSITSCSRVLEVVVAGRILLLEAAVVAGATVVAFVLTMTIAINCVDVSHSSYLLQNDQTINMQKN